MDEEEKIAEFRYFTRHSFRNEQLMNSTNFAHAVCLTPSSAQTNNVSVLVVRSWANSYPEKNPCSPSYIIVCYEYDYRTLKGVALQSLKVDLHPRKQTAT